MEQLGLHIEIVALNVSALRMSLCGGGGVTNNDVLIAKQFLAGKI